MMILTSFIATYACIISSLRSSCPCRSTFTAQRMLPYHSSLAGESVASVANLSPDEFSAQHRSTSELLRTL
jgi:hypothetical protein